MGVKSRLEKSEKWEKESNVRQGTVIAGGLDVHLVLAGELEDYFRRFAHDTGSFLERVHVVVVEGALAFEGQETIHWEVAEMYKQTPRLLRLVESALQVEEHADWHVPV